MVVRKATGLDPAGTYNQMMNSRNAYDPTRYAWRNPTGPSTMFRKFLSEPTTTPSTRLGHLARARLMGINRAVDTGYRGTQLLKRWPNASIMLAGTYPAAKGMIQDQADDVIRNRERAENMPHWKDNKDYYGMPISSMAAGLMGSLGGPDAISSFVNQIRPQ